MSTFENEVLREVLAELARQYDITVASLNLQRSFTGSFRHDDLETALNDILKPLGIPFLLSEDGKKVQILEE